MAPPSYADLGKQTRDLFSKNYRKNGLVFKIKPSNRRESESSCPCGHRCTNDQTTSSSATVSSSSSSPDGHQDNSNNSVSTSMSIHPDETDPCERGRGKVRLKDEKLISSSARLISSSVKIISSSVIFSLCEDFGLVKLDVKTKTPSGVDFTVNGNSNNDTGRVTAALETKYLIKDYGLTMKEKWNTDNILSSEVTIEDQVVKGLKIGVNCSFAPQSGKKTGGVKTAFKTDSLHLNSDIDLDYAGALIHGSGVLGYQGWLAGAQLSFDPSKNRLTRTNFAIGFNTPEFILHTNV